jgi:hypothetical protein
MKTVIKTFFIVIVFLFAIIESVAKNNPPVPNPNGRNNGFPPPIPPGLPIDKNLPFLLVIAILFGMYVIYSQNIKTKNQY